MNQRNSNPVICEQKQLRGSKIEDLFVGIAGQPNSALLLSGGSSDSARFSVVGYDPFCVVRSKDFYTEIIRGGVTEVWQGDPFVHLKTILDQYRVASPAGKVQVTAAALGYFGYELKNRLERLPQTARDELCLPQLYFCFYRLLLIHDRHTDSWYLSCYTPPQETDDHESRMRAFIAQLSTQPAVRTTGNAKRQLVSDFTKQTYMQAVERVRQYIADGHVYQANISQRFSLPFGGHPYQTFLTMFRLNPAPFYAFLNAGDFCVLCTSPERFLLQISDYVETRPIKGTCPRGTTPEKDRKLRQELLASPKDDAELSMIVDLLRNDLSKVCRGGSVKVAQHKRIEGYANVYHLVSIVEGRLAAGKNRMDLVRACFPGGSITGCPKIRAMEIIDELEPLARGIYTGSIGYLSLHDTMDLNIAIRTAVIKKGQLHFNVGGGIVYDSDPEQEYQETLHKGASILKSLGYSEEALDMG